ncbi:MAG: CBS domain-containing protein [Pseudomonadota bacterium]
MLVQQILTSKSSDGVLTVPPGESVSQAAKVLSEHGIGTVVVSKDGKHAEGILSERDVVRALGKQGPACLSKAVDQLMTPNPIVCALSDTAMSVMSTMTTRRFRHMPVVEDGKMVGLISLGDVVKARLSELEVEKEALEGMIMGH